MPLFPTSIQDPATNLINTCHKSFLLILDFFKTEAKFLLYVDADFDDKTDKGKWEDNVKEGNIADWFRSFFFWFESHKSPMSIFFLNVQEGIPRGKKKNLIVNLANHFLLNPDFFVYFLSFLHSVFFHGLTNLCSPFLGKAQNRSFFWMLQKHPGFAKWAWPRIVGQINLSNSSFLMDGFHLFLVNLHKVWKGWKCFITKMTAPKLRMALNYPGKNLHFFAAKKYFFSRKQPKDKTRRLQQYRQGDQVDAREPKTSAR